MPPATHLPSRQRHRLFALVFFASGFAGLIYESIWSHYLKLFLGHAAYAQTLVLAIFMGGMAIGAAAAGRGVSRLRHPLRAYALVELAIGVLALAFHDVFVGSTEALYAWAASGTPGPGAFAAAKWLLASALILPASILLGATFPLFAAGYARSAPGREGFALATLYFANSLGGAIGVLASGFWAIPALGLPGTIAAAGACNLLIALVMWRLGGPASAAPQSLAAVPTRAAAPAGDGTVGLLLAVAFLTGASSFVYEVGWIRMLSLVLGSATHSFELMLSAFILGLALGGWWIRGRIDRCDNPGALLGKVQVWMGICALATLPLYQLTFDFVAWLVATAPKSDAGYWLLNLGRYTVSAVIMLPAAFCAGMTLPLATRLLFAQPGQGERAIGRIYSANTLGAIAGVAFAIHVGLPQFGLKYLVAIGAAVDLALGLWLLARYARQRTLGFGGLALVGCAGGSVAIAAGFDPQHLTSGVYRSGVARSSNTVVAVADGKTATISVDREPGGALLIRTNGKPDASAVVGGIGYKMDEVTMALLAAVPLALHPAPQRVANIGFGSGITGDVLLSDPRVTTLDTIEIEPRMVELAGHFRPLNERIFSDPRSRIHFDDAKSFFAAQRQTYDLIVSEPSNPWVSGVSSLFSTEFYAHARRHLAPDGLFAQWLQVYEIHPDRVASVIKAVGENFPDYALIALNYGDLLLVARNSAPLALPDDWAEPLALATRQLLDRLEVRSGADLAYRVVGTKAMLQPWLDHRAVPAHSDFRPYLDQHADRDRFVGESWPAGQLDGELSPYLLQEFLGSRPPVPGVMRVAVNHHFGRLPPVGVAQAALLAATGAHNGAASRWPGPPEVWQAGQALIDDCRQPPGGDAGYALTRLAGTVMPYLSASEGGALLAALGDLACWRNPLGEAGTLWHQLLTGLASRDQSLGRTAEALLLAGEGRTAPRARYLLGLALSSYLHHGERTRAAALWQRLGPTLAPPGERSLGMELLAAQLER